jgi:phage protein D
MAESFSQQATVEVDGAPLDAAIEALLETMVVEVDADVPDMASLSFRDVGRTVLDDARIRIGTRLSVKAAKSGEAQQTQVFAGEVVGFEASVTETGSIAVVRAFDHSHRLARGRRTKSYSGMKDSDIAREIAERVGLEVGTIEDSGPVHEHISQHNQTDMEFLRSRAAEIGFEVGVHEAKFDFRTPAESSSGPAEGDYDSDDPLQLVYGADLLEFRPRLSSNGQVGKVQVRGWDPVKKEALIGEALAATSSTDVPAKPADLASVFGDTMLVATEKPHRSQASVDAAARSIAEQVGNASVTAEGRALGNPRIKPGSVVSISVVGEPFNGRYAVTSVTHRFTQQGYRTGFVVTGRLDHSLLGLTAGGNGSGSSRDERISGVVCALVTNNDDPEQLGRVKLKFPWLSDDYESDWARLATLGAGPDSGVIFLPEVNDEVLVAFEHGDMRRPYVVGGLWNGKDKPRLGDGLFDTGAVKRRGIVSRRGHRVLLFDADGDSGIALLSSDDKLRIALKETGTEIHVTSDGTILVESTRDITVKGSANVSVEASGTLTLKGQGGVTINSSGVVDVDGSLIQLN